MARITQTEITDPALIRAICKMQTACVIAWNAAELNHGIGQTDQLPAGATYGASGRGTSGGPGWCPPGITPGTHRLRIERSHGDRSAIQLPRGG